MTIREAFCSAARKGCETVYTIGVTATGALHSASIPAMASHHAGFQMEPESVFAAVLLTTVAGGVLGYAFAQASLHGAYEEAKRDKRVFAIARSWAQSQKKPIPPSAIVR